MNDREYKKGYPDRKGWFDCMIDGVQIDLVHNYCELTRKHKWILPDGGLVTDEVLWREKK